MEETDGEDGLGLSNFTRMNLVEKGMFWMLMAGGTAIMAMFNWYWQFIPDAGDPKWEFVNRSVTYISYWIICWVFTRTTYTIGGRIKT